MITRTRAEPLFDLGAAHQLVRVHQHGVEGSRIRQGQIWPGEIWPLSRAPSCMTVSLSRSAWRTSSGAATGSKRS
jgi:hypothetical protein